jgi:hypothetical protein
MNKPADFNMAIIRLETPYETRKGTLKALNCHDDLDFKRSGLLSFRK